ncbi:hypothetical protein HNQ91_003644 [Filimonas zeae]|uniref:Uncharacterized protein n=1 Tax=Filimonas zeae TaxID=1737353 RepID=A0A917MXH2_9BACT|nr:hypothetical protein [Filimonas zeae]MDR6340579.1 hypothetical protein [Filimonas zeae]GGH73386.1 hypothetical protein GCM10011379_34850 [Filimonas zeae]
MKTELLPQPAQQPYALYTGALPNLFLLLQHDLHPDNIPLLFQNGQLESRVNDVKQQCHNLIHEFSCLICYGTDATGNSTLQRSWCAENTLLDIAYRYIKIHPELKTVYQPALDAIIEVYNFLDTHFKQLHPAGSKMPDIIIEKYITTMKRAYHKLLQAHNQNGLLKALLHPAWEVIKHPGKGNNTYHRVTYAFQLLGRVKLWHQRKGSYDELYGIALSMNVNSQAFLEYISVMGKKALDAFADEAAKHQQIKNWHQQYREEVWITTHTAVRESYNAEERHVASFFTDWLQEQKEFLVLCNHEADEKIRLQIAKDLAFLCWHTRISIEAGFYSEEITTHIIRVITGYISTKNTPAPSFNSVEKLIRSIEIPWQVKDELKAYFNRCMAQLLKVPEKGVRPSKKKTDTIAINKRKANTKTKQ